MACAYQVEPGYLGLFHSFASCLLCDVGQVTKPLWVPISLLTNIEIKVKSFTWVILKNGIIMYMKEHYWRGKNVKVLVTQSCLTLCDPMDTASFVHGILQARILEWIAISFYRGFPYSGIKLGPPGLQADSSPSEPWPGDITTLVFACFRG